MAKKPGGSKKVTAIRRQAEEALRTTRRDVAAMPVKDVQQLVHELQVHQIELEMQNDELRRTQLELEAARDRYLDLYDFSPVGHLTLNTHGKIVESNLRAGTLLGINRNKLIGQSLPLFVVSNDQDILHRHCQDVLKTGMRQVCEVHLREKDGTSCCVYLESLAVQEESGPITHWRTALMDISARKVVEAKLRHSDTQLQAILDNSPGMLFLKDVEGRYLHVNRQFERVFHMTREQVVGKTDETIFLPDQAAAYRANDLKALQAGGPLEFEEVAMHEDGPHTSIVSKFPLYGEDGKPYALCGMTTDITERKIAEEMLRSNDIFIRGILNSLSAHICVLDKNGVILKTNDAWDAFARRNSNRGVSSIGVGENYLGVCRQAIAGGPSTAKSTLDGIEAVLAGNEPNFTQEYACHSPHEKRWFLMRVTPLKDAKGVVIAHTDISVQIQAGLALEEHVLLLNEKQKELEALAGKLIVGQEEERKRIARDLHDDFNQRLAALSVELENMERTALPLAGPQARQLAEIRSQVVQLSDDLHDLAYRLHPSLLDHVGLEVALRDHAAEFAKRTGLPVTFTGREVPQTLLPEIATNLFRVMQESLQNVSKHAEATEVTVKLSGSSKGVGLSVRDNGKGFDLENKGACVNGLGLVSMQERVRGLGGFLRIHSLPRTGTKVCAWIPRSQERA
jgi:PAS domain S-box-containing protein